MVHTHYMTRIALFCMIGSILCKDCVKIDQCKCSFDDGSGVVDISLLGRQDRTPLIDQIFAPDNYAYSYNPCYPFTQGTCTNCAACQYDATNVIYYNIGDSVKVTFSYDGLNVVATYVSDDGIRTSVVTLVCDPSVNVSTYTVQGEISVARYGFQVTSKYACASSLLSSSTLPTPPTPVTSVSSSTIDPNIKPKCKTKTDCSCIFNDGTGTVDVAVLGRTDGTPLINNMFASDGYGYSFNPCYPFNMETCTNAAVCRFDSSTKTYTNIGSSTGVEYTFDGNNVVGTYKSIEGKGTSLVTYICDLHLLISYYNVVGEVAPGIFQGSYMTAAKMEARAPFYEASYRTFFNITITTNKVCPSSCGKFVGRE